MGYSFRLTARVVYMHHPTDKIVHTMAFVTPVVEYWLEWEIAQWVWNRKPQSTVKQYINCKPFPSLLDKHDKQFKIVPLLDKQFKIVPLLDKQFKIVPLLDKQFKIVPLLDKQFKIVPLLDKQFKIVPLLDKQFKIVPLLDKQFKIVPLLDKQFKITLFDLI